jgi:hypothetical protein
VHSQPQRPQAQHRPGDFRIVTPSNWYVLDLDPATRDTAIARLVERRFGAGDDPQMTRARGELTELLRGAARDAQENGAAYAAVMNVLVDGVPLSASLIAVRADAPLDEDGNAVTDPAALSELLLATELAEAVEAAFRPPAAEDPTAEDSPAADTATDPAADDEAPEIVELPAGPAIRRRRIIGGAAETQYVLPVPDSAQMLVLTFATPDVGFRWHFEDVFDRIARSLEWQTEGRQA